MAQLTAGKLHTGVPGLAQYDKVADTARPDTIATVNIAASGDVVCQF